MRHVMNFTDVDDRTILESQKAGVPLREYTDRYIAAFREDAAALGLETVEEQPARHRQREHHGDGRDDRRAREARPHLSERRIDLLQDLDVSRVRQARAARSLRASRAARASTPTSTRRTTPAISCCGRRASRASRTGTPASAPAVPAGTSSARRWRCGCSASADRHPRRRRRPDFSASRERDRAERRRDRPAVRALLDARRAPDGRGGRRPHREDVEVARQRLQPRRHRRARATGRRRCATCISACTTASS